MKTNPDDYGFLISDDGDSQIRCQKKDEHFSIVHIYRLVPETRFGIARRTKFWVADPSCGICLDYCAAQSLAKFIIEGK